MWSSDEGFNDSHILFSTAVIVNNQKGAFVLLGGASKDLTEPAGPSAAPPPRSAAGMPYV